MAIKIVKHGHEPEPQKFAIEFKCPYCHCDFYADDTFDSIYKDYYTTAANFELRYACPECGETAKQIDIADYNEVFGKPTLFERLRVIFETPLGRYYRIQHKKKSVRFALHFKCCCGCEFWADDKEVFDYCMGNDIVSQHLCWNAYCPECKRLVQSGESPVPREKIFDD